MTDEQKYALLFATSDFLREGIARECMPDCGIVSIPILQRRCGAGGIARLASLRAAMIVKRRGAGRKPNLAKRLLKGFTRDAIALAVEDLDVKTVIIGLLKSKREHDLKP